MNEEIAKEWTAALRSGKYEQGQWMLRKGDTFCCLGVLCELAVAKGIIPPAIVERSGSDVIHVYDSADACLPHSVRRWAGMQSLIGEIGDNALSAMNDNGSTFAEIADIIDRDWQTF